MKLSEGGDQFSPASMVSMCSMVGKEEEAALLTIQEILSHLICSCILLTWIHEITLVLIQTCQSRTTQQQVRVGESKHIYSQNLPQVQQQETDYRSYAGMCRCIHVCLFICKTAASLKAHQIIQINLFCNP